jgi:propane monooxygenase reductase component
MPPPPGGWDAPGRGMTARTIAARHDNDMGEKHIARLEPVGIEMEVDEDETILDAAFRQGLMLMHGCKEGQCAACKSFLLDGEVDLDRYSTFALPDFEEQEGYTLLCRAHAVTDVEIELINYDEEILRSGVPIVTADAEVEAVEELTHDIRRLLLRVPDPITFHAGQYMDIAIPGADGEHRSFSMANTPGDPEHLEFMIKLYEGGRFSGLLANGSGIKVGDTLTCTGPYGVFTLRETSPRRLVFIAGGAGMAPIVSLLRSMAEKGSTRPATFYYGARTEADLFVLDELDRLVARLPELRFVPALSESDPTTGWTGESGLITDVVDRLEGDLTDVDAYLCGPPPMVDAAVALLERRGCAESRIYFDKFTTTAD